MIHAAMSRLSDMIGEYVAAGRTLERLSEVSGVPLQTIKRIRQGTTENPYMDTVVRLVKTLGGSLDELFGLSTDAVLIVNAAPDVSSAVTDDQTANIAIVRDITTSLQKTFLAIMREREESHRTHVADLINGNKRHQKFLIFALVCCAVFNILQLAAFVGFYFYDITHPGRGWFQIQQTLMNGASLTTTICAVRHSIRHVSLW